MSDKPFWTFIPKNIAVKAVEGIVVTGWFTFNVLHTETLEEGGGEPQLKTHWLTNFEEPFDLTIPKWMFPNKAVGEICMNDVITVLNDNIFSKPFQPVPPVPTDLPMHRVPPSRRDAIKKALGK